MISPPSEELPQWQEYIRTLIKVEMASLFERLSEKPALQAMYDVAQKQIRFLNAQIDERDRALANQFEAFRQQKGKADYLQGCGEHNTELLAEVKRLRDRELQLEQEIHRWKTAQDAEATKKQVEKLEKKLARLTGLAEDLVQEASEA